MVILKKINLKYLFYKLKMIILLSLGVFYIFFNYQNFYNSNEINLETNIGNNQGFHPKVISFSKMWNGFKYWIAYTPYPFRDCTKENPTINASNDLKKWVSPKGLNNPLDIPNKSDNYHFNSDSHLLYNTETKELEIFWRYVNVKNNSLNITIYKKSSKNGIIWSKKNLFLKSENSLFHDFLSPAILYINKTYKVWYVYDKKIHYLEKKGEIILIHKILNINFKNNYYPWHLDLIYNNNKKIYEIIISAYMNENKNFQLFYTSSKDNEIFERPFIIMKPSKNKLKWDSDGIYRSSLLYENGIYYIFYGAHDEKGYSGIGLMYGKSIKNLKPYV